MKKYILFFLLCVNYVFGAVGCDLNDPDRDVKRLFPTSTNYKTEYKTLDEKDLPKVEEQLGDKFTGIYETIDVPYTIYTIFKGEEIIGYIHGINQKGKYGGLQVFLGYDKKWTVTDFYIQKLTSKNAKDLRSAEFAKQFVGLSLHHFNTSHIKNPLPDDDIDFKAILRAVKKNLILVDVFKN
ncbi:MAG: hypothetical protein Ta2D_03110 [Rickettsiales bacterium]|nr:MAG: hypothetical protein Ta2D_03110 [Rickettsiales bacterium]